MSAISPMPQLREEGIEKSGTRRPVRRAFTTEGVERTELVDHRDHGARRVIGHTGHRGHRGI
jgi:hypothetical protein